MLAGPDQPRDVRGRSFRAGRPAAVRDAAAATAVPAAARGYHEQVPGQPGDALG